MNFSGTLTRLLEDDRQTIGRLSIYQDVHHLFSCYTLELPFRHNAPFMSCIPPGRYTCHRRYSDKWHNHWHVKDVAGRDLILIHAGNYHRDTEGCILPGADVIDIDGDGRKDVTNSASTMRTLNSVITSNTFELTIYPALRRVA